MCARKAPAKRSALQPGAERKFTATHRRALIPAADVGPRAFVNDHCANCFEPLLLDLRGLFCSDWCGDSAELARYWRGAIRDGRAARDPLVVEAINTQMVLLLAGGYEGKARRLSTATRAAVRERDAGLCRFCGKPGTEIDHVDGSSGELSNLRLLCGKCHRERTAKSPITVPFDAKLLSELYFRRRIQPADPVLLADAYGEWNELRRKLQAARKKRLVDRMEALGIETAGLSWMQLVRVLRECIGNEAETIFENIARDAATTGAN